MANDRIKVPGYVKKVTYAGGIEYRNFSDSLVGNQLTSDGGTTLFSSTNFRITTNNEPKISKTFITNPFGEFICLDDLKMSKEEAQIFLDKNLKVKLNFDKSDLSNYAYFGSLREYIRVSLENIIINWPASIYVVPISSFDPTLSGPTFESLVFDSVTNVTNFNVSTTRFVNKYNVNHTKYGNSLNNFSDSNELRNMSVNYSSYVVNTQNGDFPIIGFVGSTSNTQYIKLEVEGNPFEGLPSNTVYHIKPNGLMVEKFFNNLNDFEGHLLNRTTVPMYTSTFNFTVETEMGNIIETKKQLTWPVLDGYNIDFETDGYIDYVNELLNISENNDALNSDLVSRFFVAGAIHDFDTPDQRIGKTLRIYGREFDEIKRHIDGISNALIVSYDRVGNTPDLLVKNLAKMLGWDLTMSVNDIDLLSNYLYASESTFDGENRGLTPIEAEVEMWRRIILNTPWLWKSKGTRKAIEFIFKFMGSPEGLIDFNEFIYVANKSLDIQEFRNILEANGERPDITNYNIDNEGFPKTLPNNSDMYFQKGGLWYRETGGANANIDILTGNNPHIGPYDAGYEYISQFECLLPEFNSNTLIEEKITVEETNLFTNYDNGTFDGVFSNDVVHTIFLNVDFEKIFFDQVSESVNNLQIIPSFSGCNATSKLNIKASLDNEEFYSGQFGTNMTLSSGVVVVSGSSVQSQYLAQIENIYNELNTNFSPLEMSVNGDVVTFLEDLTKCKDDDYYSGKRLIIDVCLDINFDCIGGDCEAESLIVSFVDPITKIVNFENVKNNIVPSSGCCDALGYDFSATTGGFFCLEPPAPIPVNANIYAYFDTTSMMISDAVVAANALNEWYDSLSDTFPNYLGQLYIIPLQDEKWLKNATRPWTGDMSELRLDSGWGDIAQLPPSGASGDTEVIVLSFIDEAEPEYHPGNTSAGFGGINPQPTATFRDDYKTFMDVYDNYSYFKCLLYPIVRYTSGSGGALVLQILGVLEGRTLTSGELPTTTVPITAILTSNPYNGANYPSVEPYQGTMEPLKYYGFSGRYDKVSPASAVFSSQTFADDLNEFIEN